METLIHLVINLIKYDSENSSLVLDNEFNSTKKEFFEKLLLFLHNTKLNLDSQLKYTINRDIILLIDVFMAKIFMTLKLENFSLYKQEFEAYNIDLESIESPIFKFIFFIIISNSVFKCPELKAYYANISSFLLKKEIFVNFKIYIFEQTKQLMYIVK